MTPTTWPLSARPAAAWRQPRQPAAVRHRARQRTVSNERFFPAVAIVRSKIQLGLNAWGADFPTASDYFLPVLSCRSFYEDPANTSNYAEFCDPHADQLASQAQAIQLTDPAAARGRSAQVGPLLDQMWVRYSTSSLGAAEVHTPPARPYMPAPGRSVRRTLATTQDHLRQEVPRTAAPAGDAAACPAGLGQNRLVCAQPPARDWLVAGRLITLNTRARLREANHPVVARRCRPGLASAGWALGAAATRVASMLCQGVPGGRRITTMSAAWSQGWSCSRTWSPVP